MPLEIEILDTVIERLRQANTATFGSLFGTFYGNKVLIISIGFRASFTMSYRDSSPSSSETSFDKSQVIFPAGIDPIGILAVKSSEVVDKEEIVRRLKYVQVTNNPLYLEKCSLTNEIRISCLIDGKLILTSFTNMTSATFQEMFIYLRLVGNLSLSLPVGNEDSPMNLDEFEELSKRISEEMIFRIGKTDLFISRHAAFHNLQCSIGKVYDMTKSGKKRDWKSGFEVQNVYGLFPSTLRVHLGKNIYAPLTVDFSKSYLSKPLNDILTYDEKIGGFKINIELPFDGLCLVHRKKHIQDVYFSLIDCAERTAYLCELHAKSQIENPLGLIVLHAYHFNPIGLGHPMTLIYTEDEREIDLEEVRSGVHKFFELSYEKPLFKRACALEFKDPDYIHIPLMNVHSALKSGKLRTPNSKTAYVQGYYEYYHYMQSGIDDREWGCAYRSLQTICSWYKLQGYTSKPVPTHEEIQMSLVICGDKSFEIVKSKTWIGTVEVSHALESYLLNISSKIVSVPNREDLVNLGPQLDEHFRTCGTPVTISGGHFAFTIVGVSYDEDFGQIKFLILDPHYIGEEDLEKILLHGFVGWKGTHFWYSDTIYELCLPQRPNINF